MTPRSFAKPLMSGIMPDMCRVDQGDQHIDVEKEGHGNSSRSALTISGVTMTPASPTGGRGTAFCSAPTAGWP
jgi:hypothetical protein